MRLAFDIDGLVCTQQVDGDYDNARPYPEAVRTINRLYDEGNEIIMFTSRFMGRNKGDASKAHNQGYEYTRKQLDSWGIKYHALIMGKLLYDKIIDDKSVFFRDDWDAIYAECTGRKPAARP